MEIRIHAAVPIDRNFEEYIKEKFNRLEKFIFDEGTADLHIKKEGPFYVSEITIHSRQHSMFIKEQDNDLNKSVEILFDRTKRQARKMHDKIVDRPHKQ